MIQFVVVAGRTEGVAALAAGLDAALEKTSVLAGRATTAIGPSGRWAAAAIGAPDVLCADRWVIDHDAMLVFNGPALNLAGPQSEIAGQALEDFTRGGTAALGRRLGGIYNVVGVSADGLRAFGDLSGLAPLYWARGPGVTVVSNRASALAEVLGLDGWNRQALTWVLARGGLLGPDLPIQGVSYVAPGTELRVDLHGAAELVRSSSWVWSPPASDGGRPDLDPAEWDQLTHELIASFRSLASLDQQIKLFLTGGKDSRLCLALAKAAGLRDQVLTVTTGAPESGEAVYARMVAGAARFSHEMHKGVGGRATEGRATGGKAVVRDPSGVRWALLRQHVFRHEGTVTAWDGFVDAGQSALDIKGIGGEFYRRSGSAWMRSQTTASAAAFGDHLVSLQGKNPLRILRWDRHRANVAWLREWADLNGEEVRADLLTEKFYADFALGHHNGTIFQNRPLTAKLAPLVLGSAVRKNLELSERARTAERLHYEVMRRAAPELVGLPFLNDVWSPEILGAPRPEQLDLPAANLPLTPGHDRRSWRWDFIAKESEAISRLFEEAGGAGLGDICHVDRLRSAIAKPEKLTGPGQIKPIFGAIGASLFLLGRGERVVDG